MSFKRFKIKKKTLISDSITTHNNKIRYKTGTYKHINSFKYLLIFVFIEFSLIYNVHQNRKENHRLDKLLKVE